MLLLWWMVCFRVAQWLARSPVLCKCKLAETKPNYIRSCVKWKAQRQLLSLFHFNHCYSIQRSLLFNSSSFLTVQGKWLKDKTNKMKTLQQILSKINLIETEQDTAHCTLHQRSHFYMFYNHICLRYPNNMCLFHSDLQSGITSSVYVVVHSNVISSYIVILKQSVRKMEVSSVNLHRPPLQDCRKYKRKPQNLRIILYSVMCSPMKT